MYSFKSGRDGYFPWGNLTFDSTGNLYGATQFGGGKGNTCNPYFQYCGTVFELRPPKQKGGKWAEKVLYSFAGVQKGKQFGDGANPNGGLVLDRRGAIYGTTYFGGNNKKGVCEGGVGGTGCGTAFELSPPTKKGGVWTEKRLHVFTNGTDGTHPAAGMIFDAEGDLLGTTIDTLFRLTPTRKLGVWREDILYEFNSEAWGPEGSLVLDNAGTLYGTTYSAQNYSGIVFSLTPPGSKGGTWNFNVLYGFKGPPDGAKPASAVIFDTAGVLYSTTTMGGTGQSCQFGCGTVFDLVP